MVEIISIRFKEGGKQYYFNPNGELFRLGEGVIVETARGVEFGECTQENTEVDEMELTAPLRPVLRRATPEDQLTREKNKEKEARAFQICQEKIAEHGLEMKLVEAEYSFEGNKVLFFFTAEGRVDFRALVKDLASAIHARIELRQIGVRDEAKMLGGLGICGRPFCCSQFLEEFQPVSIKMAKTQNLSLNPTKISGTCGRLMCCLKYEQDAYEDLVKHSPKQESFVEPPLEELAKLRKPEEPEEVPDLKGAASPLAAALEAVFNGETPQYEGVGTERSSEGNGRSRDRRRSSRNRRSGGRPQEGERPAREGGRPKEEQQSHRREQRKPRPERQPKGGESREKAGGKPAQEPGEKRSRPRRRRPRGGGGGKPQGGSAGQE